MRRTLALGCCALYVAFGFVAGVAHVHRTSDHHDELRGLHVDHAHLGDAAGHGPAEHQHHEPDADRVRLDGRHLDRHHHDDALSFFVTANRSFDRSLRSTPATVVAAVAVEAPSSLSWRSVEASEPLRAPPEEPTGPARAPPA